jgi:hypothetical protein
MGQQSPLAKQWWRQRTEEVTRARARSWFIAFWRVRRGEHCAPRSLLSGQGSGEKRSGHKSTTHYYPSCTEADTMTVAWMRDELPA